MRFRNIGKSSTERGFVRRFLANNIFYTHTYKRAGARPMRFMAGYDNSF